MIKGEPSRTALLTAVQRAHHYLTAPEPKVLRDNMALALTGLGDLKAVQNYIDVMTENFAALSDLDTAAKFMTQIDWAVCMRSRVVEEKLALARVRKVKQLVILGAGLDSTAYRRQDLTDGLHVFEVDHPATQKWKQEQLTQANISVPDNLTYVAYDFENQTLNQALQVGGVKSDKMTVFTWLGVQMYLTDEAVRATFSVTGQYPHGSEIVMDFMSPTYAFADKTAQDSVADLQAVVSKMGEPIQSQYYETDLEDLLKTAGFTSVNFLNAAWLIENYLSAKFDVFDMPPEATSILTAIV